MVTNLNDKKKALHYMYQNSWNLKIVDIGKTIDIIFYQPLEVCISAYYIPNPRKVGTFPMSHNLKGSQSLSAVRTIFKIERKDL